MVGVPNAEFVACPSGVTFAAELVVTEPTAEDKEPTVVTDVLASAVGAIDPTALVVATPVGVTFALPVTVIDPTPAVVAWPEMETSAAALTVGAPKLEVVATPDTCTIAAAITVGAPTLAVADWPVGVTLASATTVRLPTLEVITPTVETSTGKGVPHAPSSQAPLPQPVRVVLLIIRGYLLLLQVTL